MPPKRLAIVIVNYRTADLAIDCLRSLETELRALGGSRVYIVDNASGDGSAERLSEAIGRSKWESWVEILPLDKNLGFAAGNNAALGPLLAAKEPPEYFLLLNPDTYIHPGAIRELLAFMDATPKAGIAGSRLENPDGTPQRAAFRFPSLLGELENALRLAPATRLLSRWVIAPLPRNETFATDWVSGASLLIRREALRATGLMDDGYFLYYEEVDLCLRARKAGWPAWHVSTSRVVHLVGQATGFDGSRLAKPKRTPGYWFASRRRFFLKTYGKAYTLATDVVWAAAFSLWRVRRVVQRKEDTDPPHLLSDFFRFNFLSRPSLVLDEPRPRPAQATGEKEKLTAAVGELGENAKRGVR